MHRDAVSTAMMVMLTERPVVCPHILYDITTPGGVVSICFNETWEVFCLSLINPVKMKTKKTTNRLLFPLEVC